MLFGVLIVLAVACCPLYWKLTWRRTAAWCTALLWLDVALLMLLGAGELGGRFAGCSAQCWAQRIAEFTPSAAHAVMGMRGCRCVLCCHLLHFPVPPQLLFQHAGFLRGAYVGASDSCKYAETLAVEEANRTVEDPQQRQQVLPCDERQLVLIIKPPVLCGLAAALRPVLLLQMHAALFDPSASACLAHLPPQVMSALAYYLGLRYIPVSQVVNELLGVPTHLLHSIVDVSGEGTGV